MRSTGIKFERAHQASILDGMEAQGWVPTLVQQQGVRDEQRNGYQKHMIRFARREDLLKEGDRPEIIFINSHDRSCARQMHAGIFRSYCMNGLIVCDGTFERLSITHMNVDPQAVVEASFEIVREIPRLMDSVEGMKAIKLSLGEAKAFAQAAIVARWDNIEDAPVGAEKLLHIVKGGQKDYARRDEKGKRMPKSRAVKGIDAAVGINKALWTLAEALKADKLSQAGLVTA